ncbi:hypothetical protein Poli38472_004707 [Pythium oligandrum]|uniref:Fido domain-containing protein n=1 Tax=Pythium oligandrum TaxID=41045 RepID=A0A8K1FID7_PYTOL|nr:hypothetical protein Poli38472_004707 [Pythium oligandrum]|eukprot:TMW59638.1 hypothetical protein Poli38472_004707 [Pythium oligandrum]
MLNLVKKASTRTTFTLELAMDAMEGEAPGALGRFTHTTAMCWAAAEGDVAMMKRLMDHGADVNAGDYDKRTPLHIAVSDNQEQAVDFLVQHGALTDVLDRWGRSPMDCALEMKNPRVLQLLERVHYAAQATPVPAEKLLRGSNERVKMSMMRKTKSHHDIPALLQAVQRGDTEKVKRIWLGGLALDSVDAQGRTSLHVAVENGQIGVIELLLSADVDTHVLDGAGRSAISIALDKRQFVIAEMLRAHQKSKSTIQVQNNEDHPYAGQAFSATKRGQLDQIKRLVPDLVHPDVQDYDLRTLIHIASAEGHLELVKYLVSCGANVNLLDRWGTSPLTEAVDFAHNDVARFLIEHHGSESGNRVSFTVDHIDNATLSTALEFILRGVARKRWHMGQVFCPMTDDHGGCVLVAHSVWHRSELQSPNKRNSSAFIFPSSPKEQSSSVSSTWNDPIQMFRKIGSLMMIDPGQGHTGRVFSAQHPEWLNLNNTQQSQMFLLPHARRAGFQTIISAPMIYKMTAIAVLSWYSTELILENADELQRIQRLLRSVTILATLRQELLMASSSTSFHIPRFQYCQSLDNALTASGELLEPSLPEDDVQVGDVLTLALDWELFNLMDKLATSMSSEDHTAVISLLRSIVQLLRNGFFAGVFQETTQAERDEPLESILARCSGSIRTRWTLLVHVRYYVMYLHAVSPTEGTIFTDVDRLLPTLNKYFAGDDVTQTRQTKKETTPPPSPLPVSPATPAEKECVLCKFKVPGHIHPGKAPIAPTPPKPPVFTSTSSQGSGEKFFGMANSPRSPVLREIEYALPKMESEYDTFERKSALSSHVWEGFRSATFTSSDLYDAIGAAHELPSRRPSIGSTSEIADQRKKLMEVINGIMEDTSCIITYDQLLQLHASVISDASEAGVIRSTAAVGYASPRIYRVFLPVGEIPDALRKLIVTINDTERWKHRPGLCAYYAFAILVFFIHPFHDGNGRCARLLGNIVAKKLGFPAVLHAADKTIQVLEFLQKVIVTMEIIRNSRRQNRQARMLSGRKENSSMWF